MRSVSEVRILVWSKSLGLKDDPLVIRLKEPDVKTAHKIINDAGKRNSTVAGIAIITRLVPDTSLTAIPGRCTFDE